MNKIEIKKGNILNSNAHVLVNTVNCVGIMGKGIALQFKNTFPGMYKDYVERCERGEVKLGEPYLYRSTVLPWILNFPTKMHWRSLSKLNDIERGLKYLVDNYKEWGIQSIAVPPLGCGNGKLEWNIIGPTLFGHLKKLEIPVEIYAPYDTPEHELTKDFLDLKANRNSCKDGSVNKNMKPAWVALVAILNCIEKEKYHTPVGRIFFQKIAFVATREGIPTELSYEKRSFGPFAPELSAIKSKLINNGLIEERNDENYPSKFNVKVGSTYSDARRLFINELKSWSPVITRVADLFTRIKTTKQAEITASVLYVSDSIKEQLKEDPMEIDVYKSVLEWKAKRIPPIEDYDIASAVRNLAIMGWIKVKHSEDLPFVEFQEVV